MFIELKKDLASGWEKVEVTKGTTIEELYRQYEAQVPYTVICARKNNKIEDLLCSIDEPCRIEFMDLRFQAANLIYQYSLSLIYLKAVRDVLGNVKVDLENALNKGIYTEIKTKEAITDDQVLAIQRRMEELVAADIPIVKEVVSRDMGVQIMKDDGQEEKLAILNENLKLKDVKFYSIDGYRDFFYGFMTPSTGYIKYFQVMKYRRGVLVRFPHQKQPDVIPEYVDEVKMYEAFSEATRWGKLLGVNYVTDLNEMTQTGEYKELIQMSEALHEKKIAEIADMIKTAKKRIVLIAGPSSSGKTTFAKRLCIQMKVNGLDPIYMGTDDYFVEREDTPLDEKGEPNFEDLEALDIQLFNDNMNDLLEGKAVDIPTFNFLTGKKEFGKRILSVTANQPIVIEGIHGLNEKLTEYIPDEAKFKIYISPLTQLSIDEHNRIPNTDQRMLRRMVRDNLYRGRDAQNTIRDWPKVRAGEDKNIFPFSGEADVLFNSFHIYETAVLKKYAEPLLKAITENEPEYSEAVRMLKFLRFFKTIEDDRIIANNSILREFIGGSIFVD